MQFQDLPNAKYIHAHARATRLGVTPQKDVIPVAAMQPLSCSNGQSTSPGDMDRQNGHLKTMYSPTTQTHTNPHYRGSSRWVVMLVVHESCSIFAGTRAGQIRTQIGGLQQTRISLGVAQHTELCWRDNGTTNNA